MSFQQITHYRWLTGSALLCVALWLTGCQGTDSPVTRGTAPTEQSRAAIRERVGQNFSMLGQSGLPVSQNAMFSAPLGFGLAGGGIAGGGAAGGAAVAGSRPGPPTIGSFLNNALSPRGRGARLHTRAENSFYYDEWMGRWIETVSDTGSYTYAVYLDEQKQNRVGWMESTWTGDPNVFPQTYRTTYEFNDTYWTGRGTYNSTYNADGSGQTTYDSEYNDYRDQGESAYNADGSSSWNSRSDGPDGYFATSQGQFDGEGNGSTASVSSDGWSYVYGYHADGSGRARIEGPADGLPMDITWDAAGRTTIRYADGTTETYDYFWGWCGGGIALGGPGNGTGSGGGEGGEGGGDPGNGRKAKEK